MEKTLKQTMLEIKNMFNAIKARPQNYIGITDKRLDYLCYFLWGRLAICYDKHYGKFREDFTHWIYTYLKNNSNNYNVKFEYLWYRMIYSVTDSEDEAWALFFQIAQDYFEKYSFED